MVATCRYIAHKKTCHRSVMWLISLLLTPFTHLQLMAQSVPPPQIVIISYSSCLTYARALLEYVIFIMWVRSVSKILPSVKFAE